MAIEIQSFRTYLTCFRAADFHKYSEKRLGATIEGVHTQPGSF